MTTPAAAQAWPDVTPVTWHAAVAAGRMDQAERGHIQNEIDIAANKRFPGRIRRVELLQHGDAPMIEPGELMPRSVFADPAGGREGLPRREAVAAFKKAVGPGLNHGSRTSSNADC